MTAQPTPERLGHMLDKVGALRHRRMHELLDELGLYHGQPAMLRALWAGDGLTHSALAEQLNRSPATVTKTVKRMEKAGFVERKPDPVDGRLSRVYLTEAGCNVQAAVEQVWQEFELQAFAGFTQEEMAALRSLLQRVCHNIGGTH